LVFAPDPGAAPIARFPPDSVDSAAGRSAGAASRTSDGARACRGAPAGKDGNVKYGGSQEQLQREIAAVAARLIAEDGLDSGQARHRAAAEILGASTRAGGALPDQEQLEAALREYLRVYKGEAHLTLLRELRTLALEWMRILAPFRPHLVGAVLNGSATEHSHLHLHLFTDSAKDVEMALLDRGLDIRVGPADDGPPHAQERIGFLAPGAAPAGGTPVLLTVLDTDALRSAPGARARRQDPSLHPVERSGRATAQMVRELLDAPAGSAATEALHA